MTACCAALAGLHAHLVAAGGRRQAVRDKEGGAALPQALQRVQNTVLCAAVQRAGGLIKQQNPAGNRGLSISPCSRSPTDAG